MCLTRQFEQEQNWGMKTNLDRSLILKTLAFIGTLTLVNAYAQTNIVKVAPIEFTLPILTVSQNETGKWSGLVINLGLSVTKTSSDKPLLVAIAEDQPNGVGGQFRSAMWSAASTVALENGNPLRGYHMELTAQGSVDGPSAGAMIALAIMTALDGRTLTNDFVFTGSILPNGSVGYVGGLVQKIEAAKAAGKTRVFVPAYYRTEKDPNTGEMVDLKEKCKLLGLRMIPVANIRQAYALINNIEEVPVPIASLEIPDEVEDVFVALYHRELTNSSAVSDGLTLEEKQSVTNTPLLKMFILDRAQKADQSYRAGNIPSAYDNISDLTAGIEAVKDADQFVSKLDIKHLSTKDIINLFDKEIGVDNDERVASLSKYLNTGIAANNPALAQFDGFANEVAMFDSLEDYFNNSTLSLVTQAESNQDASQKDNLDAQARLMKYYQLWAVDAWKRSRSIIDYKEFAKLFKPKLALVTLTNRGIEQLLFNSMESAFNSYTATTLKPVADQNGISADSIANELAKTDLSFLESQCLRLASERMRESLKDDESLYMLLCQSRNHARALAKITSQTLKNELDADKNEAGNVRYGNASLLRAILQSAREEAVAAIGRCQASRVPCWGSVAAVHIADAKRDDPDEDKMDVFEAYFNAALDAKILTLMCGNN